MTDKTKRIAELEALTADIRAQGWMAPEEFNWEKHKGKCVQYDAGDEAVQEIGICLLYTSPSPRDS